MLIHAVKCDSLHRMCNEKEIIFPAEPVFEAHGGVDAVSKALGYSYQRVFNWKERGIPALEVALNPEFFAAAKQPTQADSAAQKLGASDTAKKAA